MEIQEPNREKKETVQNSMLIVRQGQKPISRLLLPSAWIATASLQLRENRKIFDLNMLMPLKFASDITDV